MLWLDAGLAYLHFIAVFVLFAFLSVELVLLKASLDERTVRLLGRMDLWYFGSAIAVLFTGILRMTLGAKGPDFYLSGWPVYAKLGLFLVVGLMSVYPTMAFIRWKRGFDHDPSWRIPAGEQSHLRRFVLVELHLAALIPLVAVIMSRGLAP